MGTPTPQNLSGRPESAGFTWAPGGRRIYMGTLTPRKLRTLTTTEARVLHPHPRPGTKLIKRRSRKNVVFQKIRRSRRSY